MATLAREKFLSQASVSLQNSVPSLAQQFRISLLSLQNTSGVADPAGTKRCCPICGSLDVELRTVEAQKISSDTQSSSAISTKPEGSSIMICKCRTCSRSKKVPVPQSKPEAVQELKSSTPEVQVGDWSANKERESKIQKTSSKKRAKERKDREGLQALLSRKPDSTRPASSFDLMDFMLNKG